MEPLFAHTVRLWLRVWVVTQSAATAVATWVVADAAGGLRVLARSPRGTVVGALLLSLIAYHVAGVLAHRWILGRRWAILLFVPLGWTLVMAALAIDGAFGLLLLGAIVQGLIYLPFAWAVTVLALVTASLAAIVVTQGRAGDASGVLARAGGIVATGVMIATVLLYIHRANREAALRTRLLRQLDAAQHDLAERAREAGVQEERQRFARDIHDTLAQGFTSVIKHLEAIELCLSAPADAERTSQRVQRHLAHAQDTSRASLAEIRRLVWALQPTALGEASLTQALGRVVAHWSEANGITATFTSDPLPPLQPDADVIFLRATQEALSNVARHARATTVAVSLSRVDTLALLTVEDDGRGFENVDQGTVERHGLAGMRERVRRCGGHVLVESALGAGTSVTVALPLSSIAAVYDAGGRGA